MLVTLDGIVIEVNPVQSSKAEFPMLVTLYGIVIDSKLKQEVNAHFPMPINCEFSANVIVSKPLPENA